MGDGKGDQHRLTNTTAESSFAILSILKCVETWVVLPYRLVYASLRVSLD